MVKTIPFCFSLLPILLLGVPQLSAQTTSGPEFRIDDHDGPFMYKPVVAGSDTGDFVVAWTNYFGSPGGDGSESSVQAKRFASDGNPIGPQFQVNHEAVGYQRAASAAMGSDGGFVVAWANITGPTRGNLMTRYGSDGQPLSDPVLISSSTLARPNIDMNQDTIAAVRASFPVGQRYSAADGSLLGDININGAPLENTTKPVVAVAPSGSFMVAWKSTTPGDYPGEVTDNIRAQVFDSNGIPVAGSLQVNEISGDSSRAAVAATDDGEFIVVWAREASWNASEVRARRISSNGTAVAEELLVSDTRPAIAPQVAVDSNGDALVAWARSPITEEQEILARVITSTGKLQGKEFRVDNGEPIDPNDLRTWPNVVDLGAGEFMVVWNQLPRNIKGRRVVNPWRQGFADGFESGNTAAWSSD